MTAVDRALRRREEAWAGVLAAHELAPGPEALEVLGVACRRYAEAEAAVRVARRGRR